MAKTELAQLFNSQIAVGDIGTQFFWLNKTSKKFEYALPVVAGAEFGGETETFEAPESDSDKVAKLVGRSTLNDVVYTSNFTPARYTRWNEILDNTKTQTYLEVLSDGSGMMFTGTAGEPRLMTGDVRTIEATIAPQREVFIPDIFKLTADDISAIQPMKIDEDGTNITLTEQEALPIDDDTIPDGRISIVDEKINVTE